MYDHVRKEPHCERKSKKEKKEEKEENEKEEEKTITIIDIPNT